MAGKKELGLQSEITRPYEGHDDPSVKDFPGVKMGATQMVGSAVSLSQTAISPNRKAGSPSGGEAGGV